VSNTNETNGNGNNSDTCNTQQACTRSAESNDAGTSVTNKDEKP